jgi:hypothetical protein
LQVKTSSGAAFEPTARAPLRSNTWDLWEVLFRGLTIPSANRRHGPPARLLGVVAGFAAERG